MFSFLKRLSKKSPKRMVGVGFSDEGISLAISDQRGKQTAVDCYFIPVDDHARFLEKLKASVKMHHLKNTPAFVVMPHDSYSLLQLSSPPMDKIELCASAKWRIRDMVNYPIDEAVVDVFDFPESGQKGAERMHYIVAAHSGEVKKRVDLIKQAGLDLQVLDIGELTIRNVMSMLKNSEDGVVMMSFNRNSGLLALVKDNEMYLARHLEVGLDDLIEEDPIVGSILTSAAESVALELQRSLDYFESKFIQAPLKKVLIYPPCIATEKLVVKMRETVSIDVSILQLSDEFENVNFSFESESDQNYLLAIGAAMRKDLEVRICNN